VNQYVTCKAYPRMPLVMFLYYEVRAGYEVGMGIKLPT